ncbi:hypothetical protein BCR43DRAFT_525324 [Syncephalastrum racemosum]|uniref:BHLH domain-containing protein n=1 Tax=Syncephalastrum racemosum TaxID=13706 RepID=A0A1X2HAB7_SYNRA|nr:hypothetical protein BCR43DRAFT_525324 [Syncephalastrum racemosum]
MEFEVPHKAASVTSTTSEPPSLYSGSSVCDADSPAPQDPAPFEADFKFNAGLDTSMAAIQIPCDEDDGTKAIVVNSGDHEGFPHFLHALKEEDKHVTVPVDTPTSSLERKRSVSVLSNDDEDDDDCSSQKRAKGRWLLSEEEKRANHIASEQKRRNTIRTGFKDMTDIIPTLKNVNNSKSTILFKAVEYIKHLDRRNRNLRDKVVGLQMRLEVKRRVSNNHSNQQHRRNTFAAPDPIHTEDGVTFANDGRRASEMIPAMGLPSGAMAALLTHKNQQKQLEILQEQLRLQQELLTKHNIQHNHHHQQRSMSFSSMAIPSSTPTSPNTALTLYSRLQEKQQQQYQQHQQHQQPWTYDSISIPSSSDEVSHQRRSSLNLLHRNSSQNLPQPQHQHHHPYHHPQHPSQTFHPSQHHSSVNISNSIPTPALVVPANDDEHNLQHQQKALQSSSHTSNHPSTTSSSVAFTIPADDDFRSA